MRAVPSAGAGRSLRLLGAVLTLSVLVGTSQLPVYAFGLRVGLELGFGGSFLLLLIHRARQGGISRSPLDLPLAVTLLVWMLSALLGENPVLGRPWLFVTAALIVGFYLALSTAGLDERTVWLEAHLLLTGVLAAVSLLTLADWYIGLGLFTDGPGWFVTQGFRLPPQLLRATPGHLIWPTQFGAYLAFAFTLALGQFLAAGKRVWLPYLGLIGLALLLTFTRAAWIGQIVATGILLTARFSDRGAHQLGRRHVWRLVPALIVGVAVVVVGLTGTWSRWTNDSLRVELYGIAVRAFADHPGVGGGPGTFGLLLMRYRLPPGPAIVTNHAHNYYLNLLAETGIVGVAGVAVLFGTIGWLGARVWRGAPSGAERVRLLAPGAALAGLATHVLFYSPGRMPGLLVPGVIALALLVRASGVRLERSRRLCATLLVAWLVVSLVTAWGEVGAYLDGRATREAGRGNWAEAAVRWERAASIDPTFDLYEQRRALALGHLAGESGQPDDWRAAMAALERGLEHERHHGLNLARLGVLDAELGDSVRAAANLRRAMELEPRDYRFAV
ncbi:MAG: O-antigen ligase family protein, partial [Chloroflexi bacterium]|nr:O-antigen ligase family protein [Chloroflexota bacterium]